ncbi:DUF397 domain-containing protein [Nocardia flavorosea]|uniref:DUF397 domain-containing protein n=1 Tax=Nocardia flavorosea TaxID=53429 RepID=A0A846YBK8_9NOCA|nr:DUF397 domain-containing protein [Nocardia flavorosea]NKY55955.1 DUF397 domain-containing protein [Nocardia flavorosea]
MSFETSEVGWFKSSHSSGQTECVEAAWLRDGRIGVRDSKNPASGELDFAPEVWAAFTAGVRQTGSSV